MVDKMLAWAELDQNGTMYDGVSKATNIVFSTIALWVCIYDLPEFIMTEDYGRTLGGQLGKVLEFGGTIRNFLRIRVAFHLERPLRA